MFHLSEDDRRRNRLAMIVLIAALLTACAAGICLTASLGGIWTF